MVIIYLVTECDNVTGECVCFENTNNGYFSKSIDSIEETCDLCKTANYDDTYCNTIDETDCNSDDKCELINGICRGLQIYYPKPFCSDGTSTSKSECDLANETWSYPENGCKTLCIKDSTCNGNGECGVNGECVCFDDVENGSWQGTSCNSCKTDYYDINCKTFCNHDNNSNLQSCNNGKCDTNNGECLCNASDVLGYFAKSDNSDKTNTCDICKTNTTDDATCKDKNVDDCNSDNDCEFIGGECVGKQYYYPKPYCDGDLTKTTKDECDTANKTWTYPENSCQTICLANSTCNGNGICGDQGQCMLWKEHVVI